jgi:hypothetical protein
VILKTVDALAANYITNSFAFELALAETQTSDLTAALKAFYDGIVGSLSSHVAQNGHEIKYTNLPGLTPNYPYAVGTFNLVSVPTGTPMPSEVAIALSFQGTKVAGLPQNRRRGRVYLGPFETTALGTDGRPSAATTTAITTAADTLRTNLAGLATPINWSVWSQVDGDVVNITDGWVDNSFDTVRRRGLQVTSKALWS